MNRPIHKFACFLAVGLTVLSVAASNHASPQRPRPETRSVFEAAQRLLPPLRPRPEIPPDAALRRSFEAHQRINAGEHRREIRRDDS